MSNWFSGLWQWREEKKELLKVVKELNSQMAGINNKSSQNEKERLDLKKAYLALQEEYKSFLKSTFDHNESQKKIVHEKDKQIADLQHKIHQQEHVNKKAAQEALDAYATLAADTKKIEELYAKVIAENLILTEENSRLKSKKRKTYEDKRQNDSMQLL